MLVKLGTERVIADCWVFSMPPEVTETGQVFRSCELGEGWTSLIDEDVHPLYNVLFSLLWKMVFPNKPSWKDEAMKGEPKGVPRG